MTIPRLILIGMAASAFADGWIWQGILLLAWVAVLQCLRPGDDYRTWA